MAQTFDWADIRYFSGTTDRGDGIVCDSEGRIYAIGEENNLVFMRYDSEGNRIWGEGPYVNAGADLAVDGDGDIYLLGDGSFLLDTIGLSATTGGNDVFVGKIDSSAHVYWAKQFWGTGTLDDVPSEVLVDKDKNVIICGSFDGYGVFGRYGVASDTLFESNGNWDVFLIKLDSAGSLLWAVQGGGSSSGSGHCNGIAVDEAGNICLTGYVQDNITFGSDSLYGEDYFIVEFDPSGNVLWAETIPYNFQSIDADVNGNWYCTGQFSGSKVFGGDSLVSGSFADVIVCKYDKDGNEVWARSGGSGSDWGLDRGVGIDVFGENLYACGSAWDTIIFGGMSAPSVSAGHCPNAYVVKYDTSGNLKWLTSTETVVCQTGGAGFFGIDSDGNGNVYVTGQSSGTVTYGFDTLDAYGITLDMVVAKLTDLDFVPLSTDEIDMGLSKSSLLAFPNPTNQRLELSVQQGTLGQITMLDLQGKVVFSKNVKGAKQTVLDVSGFPEGMYFVRRELNGSVETAKIIIAK